MKILCVIPARYKSTRLPGKPLADIAGTPMIIRVLERVIKAKNIQGVIAAVDDERVLSTVKEYGYNALMTSPHHQTGTDRLAEVALEYEDVDVIINIQGDEPLIDPDLIDALAKEFHLDENLQMATVKTLMDEEEADNPNSVKVITDQDGYAIYFSRSKIPYKRENTDLKYYKHIGIYAYRRDFLLKFASLKSTPLEKAESLEQLRALENGYKIKVIESDKQFIGVDTQEDLEKVNEIYKHLRSEENA